MSEEHRVGMVAIDNLYADPELVRAWALRQEYYTPYEDPGAVRDGSVAATWWASRSRPVADCPFKSSKALLDCLERAVGERIDRQHWAAEYPTLPDGRPARAAEFPACLWNCCFHVKPDNGQQLGDGVHNHVTDSWNAVGADGWAGIVYLSPDAPVRGGLHLWRNRDPRRQFDWMTPAANWELVDSFGNVFNRLVLVRGDVPHSGAAGWGRSLDEGRLYQTFFFRTESARSDPVTVPGIDD
jgi:hypothetical protein